MSRVRVRGTGRARGTIMGTGRARVGDMGRTMVSGTGRTRRRVGLDSLGLVRVGVGVGEIDHSSRSFFMG